MFSNGFLLSLFILLISADASGLNESTPSHGNESEWKMVPMMEPEKMGLNESIRRRLGSFKICAACTCCGGPKRNCLISPCCYVINCNIPNRPFGYCSFTPQVCNCFSCHT